MKTNNLVIKIGLIFIFLSGISLSVLVPPFQKPDEYTHFNKAAAMSAGVFKCTQSIGNAALVPQNYLNLQDEIHKFGLEHHEFAKFPYKIYAQPIFARTTSFVKVPLNIDTTCGLPTLSYVPQALILKLTQIFKFNPYVSFFVGRISMFLLSFMWLTFILRKTSHKTIIIFTFSLPIVLHQLGSFGYDVLNILVGTSIFAYLLHLREQQSFNDFDLAKLWSLIVIMMFIKPGYETFILLPLLFLPWKRFNKPWSVQGTTVLLLGALALGWHIYSSFFNVNRMTTSMSLPFTFPTLQLQYLLGHPLFAWEVLVGTTSRTFEEYAKQMIGKFGWLDYWLSPFIYPLYFALFGYLVSHIKLARQQILSVTQTIILAFWIIAQYSLIMLSVYLVWTTTGSLFVEGIQGRYFLVLVPFIIYLAVNINHHRALRYFTIGLIFISILANMILRTIERYYDFSQLFRENNLVINNAYIAKPITDSQQYYLDVTEYQNNKIAGLLLGLHNPGLATTHPYILSIKDSGCNKILREQFVQLDAVSDEPYKAIIKPLKIVGTNQLCITISPYKKLVGTPLQSMQDVNGQIAISPLIIR